MCALALQMYMDLNGFDLEKCESPEAAAQLLARSVKWVGDGQEGYEYKGKRAKTVRNPLLPPLALYHQ